MKVLGAEILICCLVMMEGLAASRAHAVSPTPGAPHASESMVVRVVGDRLAVTLKEAPLRAVLEEIGRQGGIDVIIQGPLTKTVSLEFQPLPLDEGLRRLLRGCGWMTVGQRNGKVEQLVVAETPEGLSRAGLSGTGTLRQPGPSSTAGAGREVKAQRPLEPVPTVAELMQRDALRNFVGALIAPRWDATVLVDAFGDVVDSLSAEEAGALVSMLRDKTTPPSKWDEALAALGDTVTAQERATIVRLLQDRDLREHVLKSFEQVQIFKLAQEQEALEKARKQ